jgi:hypothetical protein
MSGDTLLIVAIEADKLFLCTPPVGAIHLASRRLGWKFGVMLVGVPDPRTHRAAVAARVPVISWLSSRGIRRTVAREPDGAIAMIVTGTDIIASSEAHRSTTEFLASLVLRGVEIEDLQESRSK